MAGLLTPDASAGTDTAPAFDPGDASAGTDTAPALDTGGTGGGAAPASVEDAGTSWVGKLGLALAGGPAGVADLSPKQQEAVGRHALLNFGLNMLQGGGWSYTPKTFGQILAPSLASAEDTEGTAEQQQVARTQAAAELGLKEQGLDIRRQEAQARMAPFLLQLQRLKAVAGVTGGALGLLGGGTGTGTGTTGGTASSGGTAGGTGLPAPEQAADFSNWKDPGTRDLIIAAAKAEGLDPNIALGVAHQESQGNPNAPAGDGGKSAGIFQIGKDEAASVGIDDDARQTLTGNITAGVRYLKKLQGTYGDLPTTLTAYNAGTGRADDVRAGKATIPDSTKQYIANVTATAAQKPADGPPGKLYVPETGQVLTRTPNAAPAGGSTPPGISPAMFGQLTPDEQHVFQTRLQLAASDPTGGQTQTVLSDMAKAVAEKAKLPQKSVIPEAEAQQLFGKAWDPTAIYVRDATTGDIEVKQQPQHPLNIADTPEAKSAAVALQMDQDRLKKMADGAQSATRIVNQTDLLRALNPQLGGADLLASKFPDLLPLMQSLKVGTPAEQQRMTAQQAFSGIVNQLSIQMRDQGTGRLSNQEMAAFAKALPNIGQDQASRDMLISTVNLMANRQRQEAAYAQNYFLTHHTLAGVDDAMEKDLGPVIQHAPARTAPIADHKAFIDGLAPGTPYIDYRGQFKMKPNTSE